MEILVRGEVHEIKRVKFRRWIELDQIREKLSRAADVNDLANQIGAYLTAALDFGFSLEDTPWEETAYLWAAAITTNGEYESLPFMRYPSRDKKPIPYEYDGRTFYQYAHSIAKSYGWPLEYIAELDVDEALKLLQEIMIEHYNRREWEWDLSERAVGYDEATRKSKHNPYPLPDWMLPVPAEPKIYRIPRSLLPVGNVISYRDAKPS